MEAKLIKIDNGWVLMVDNIMYATDENAPYARLSLKNCEEVELGYDLYELAIESSREYFIKPIESPIFTFGYEEGFLKALSILGDKKFSEEDMRKAFVSGSNVFIEDGMDDVFGSEFQKEEDDFIQSLQQTEWDVERVAHAKKNGSYTKEDGFEQEPKLDADVCIILKRKI